MLLKTQNLIMPMPSFITLVTLGVRDVSSATEFYERLGWKKSSASNEQITFFHSSGTALALFGCQALADDAHVNEPLDGFKGVTLAQNFNSEIEVDQAFEHAIACGAQPLKQPQKVFWGGYSSYFSDPDGHVWELAHNPFVKLGVDGHMTLP